MTNSYQEIPQLAKEHSESNKNLSSDKQNKKESVEANPYLQSRALWNDMYGSLQIKLQNSYRIIFILAVVIGIAMLSISIMAGQSKIKPYVALIHGEDIITMDESNLNQFNAMRPKLALIFAKQFIRHTRQVSSDNYVNRQNQLLAYSLVNRAALTKVENYYQENNPAKIAQHQTNQIFVASILRISPNTLTMRWKEEWFSVKTGQKREVKHYIANITYEFDKPSQNKVILKNNPFGFYITHLSWSEDKNSEGENT